MLRRRRALRTTTTAVTRQRRILLQAPPMLHSHGTPIRLVVTYNGSCTAAPGAITRQPGMISNDPRLCDLTAPPRWLYNQHDRFNADGVVRPQSNPLS